MAIPNVTRGGLRSARLLAAGTATRIVLTPVVMALILVPEDGDDTAVLLAGLGVRELSMAASRIPAAKAALREVDFETAAERARRALPAR